MKREDKAKQIIRSTSKMWEILETLSSEIYFEVDDIEIDDTYDPDYDPDEHLDAVESSLSHLQKDEQYLVDSERFGDFDDIEFPDHFEMEYEYHQQEIIRLIQNFKLAVANRNYDLMREAWELAMSHSDESSNDFIDDDIKTEIYETIEDLNRIIPLNIYSSIKQNDIVAKSFLISATSQIYHEIAKDPSKIYSLSPRGFEEFIADIFLSFGFKVELTAKTRDGGRDIIAIGNENNIKTKYLIECKRFSPNRPVGVSYIRELYAVKQFEHASKAILATTSFFSKDAREIETKYLYELELKDFNAISEWAKYYSQWLNNLKSI